MTSLYRAATAIRVRSTYESAFPCACVRRVDVRSGRETPWINESCIQGGPRYGVMDDVATSWGSIP